MQYVGGPRLISPDQLYQDQRASVQQRSNDDMADAGDQSQQPVSAGDSANYNNAVAQATGHIVKLLSMNNATNNVPSYNKYEQNGRNGLVDPSQVGQATMLPQERRMEQAQNFQAIVRSLPPAMMQQNMQLLQMANTDPIPLAKQLKARSSIYNQLGGAGDFATNRINLALQDKRLNSIYALV